jgi:hypothetical protein
MPRRCIAGCSLITASTWVAWKTSTSGLSGARRVRQRSIAGSTQGLHHRPLGLAASDAYFDTKPEEISAWTKSDIVKNLRLIPFEPAWYFFNLPTGTFELGNSSQVPSSTQPGQAKESLKKLMEFLLAAP